MDADIIPNNNYYQMSGVRFNHLNGDSEVSVGPTL